ncbi:MAG: DUF5069 domain-containing protein [Candidatus Eremiobacteraeota bacterium]|nr:DUF5069 domain-containing protein [Candidatus Eremiobacteraeota bacterium]
MTTTIPDFDLRAHPPRPSREKLGGISFLPRTIDKVRAKLAGTMGPFKIGPGMSKILLDDLGIPETDFIAAVRDAKSDEDVLAWVRAHSDPAQYDAISEKLENRTFRSTAHRAEMESRYPVMR